MNQQQQMYDWLIHQIGVFALGWCMGYILAVYYAQWVLKEKLSRQEILNATFFTMVLAFFVTGMIIALCS